MKIVSVAKFTELVILLRLISVINFFGVRLDFITGNWKLLERFYVEVVAAHSLLIVLSLVLSYLRKGLSILKFPSKFKVFPIKFPFFRIFRPLLLPLSGFAIIFSFFSGFSVSCGSEIFFTQAIDGIFFGINSGSISLRLHLLGIFFLVCFGSKVIVFRVVFYSLAFFNKLYELIKIRAMVIYYVALYLATLPKRVRKAILCFLVFYYFICFVTLRACALVFAREHKLLGVIELNSFLFWVKEVSWKLLNSIVPKVRAAPNFCPDGCRYWHIRGDASNYHHLFYNCHFAYVNDIRMCHCPGLRFTRGFTELWGSKDSCLIAESAFSKTYLAVMSDCLNYSGAASPEKKDGLLQLGELTKSNADSFGSAFYRADQLKRVAEYYGHLPGGSKIMIPRKFILSKYVFFTDLILNLGVNGGVEAKYPHELEWGFRYLNCKLVEEMKPGYKVNPYPVVRRL